MQLKKEEKSTHKHHCRIGGLPSLLVRLKCNYLVSVISGSDRVIKS